jgi:IS6 family transposase
VLLLASSVCGLFRWRQFEPAVILLAVGWYLRFSFLTGTWRSCSRRARSARRSRHGVALGPAVCPQKWNAVCDRGSDRPSTVGDWTKPTSESRASGSIYTGLSTHPGNHRLLLSVKRDAAAAERFLAKALGGENHPAPRIINTDEHAGYPPAIVCGSKPKMLWRRIADIDQYST